MLYILKDVTLAHSALWVEAWHDTILRPIPYTHCVGIWNTDKR